MCTYAFSFVCLSVRRCLCVRARDLESCDRISELAASDGVSFASKYRVTLCTSLSCHYKYLGFCPAPAFWAGDRELSKLQAGGVSVVWSMQTDFQSTDSDCAARAAREPTGELMADVQSTVTVLLGWLGNPLES